VLPTQAGTEWLWPAEAAKGLLLLAVLQLLTALLSLGPSPEASPPPLLPEIDHADIAVA
jgi:hypothetical protein